MRATGRLLMLLLFFFLSIQTSGVAGVADKLERGQNLTDGQTLVSPGGSYTMGFFSPGASTKRYLGIWFTVSNDTVVYWVANRDQPLPDRSGMLVFNDVDSLVLVDGFRQTAWSSNFLVASAAVLQLLDSGNLVVRNGSSDTSLWQSFDQPSDTLLPGMKLGKNLWTGGEWQLSAWRSPDDPSPGDYRRTLESSGLPELVVWQGNVKKYRTGPCNGLYFNGVQYADKYQLRVTASQWEMTYEYTASPGAPPTRVMVDHTGLVERLVWDVSTGEWIPYFKGPRDPCDPYATCGAFGLCNAANAASQSFCTCVDGFSPVSMSAWQMKDTKGGCRRDSPLDCAASGKTTTDGFKVVPGVKLPDTQNASVDIASRHAERVQLEECRERCFADCSCLAYAAADIDGTGCVIWKDDILDLRFVDDGQNLYLRLSKSEFADDHRRFPTLLVATPVASAIMILLVGFAIWWRRKRRIIGKSEARSPSLGRQQAARGLSRKMDLDGVLSPRHLSYDFLKKITDGFSDDRECGRGTYGKVYLGLNKGGEKIAVKLLYDMPSLEDNDTQFEKEFHNLTSLKHPNIVRFVGHCHETRRECITHNGQMILADATKRALCFEYMHNGSLDNFLSDEFTGHDWHTRYAIIKGICDGLKYLHEELQPPIFHLDLKPANILLDEDMVPKLADFGLSRLFGEERTQITTSNIGTIGYLPPEFINQHVISNKFDIFSLGVVIIKIMTGRKGYSKCGEMPSHEFLELVHENWRSRLHAESVCVLASYCEQVKRCMELALSCVEVDRQQRPSIGDIVNKLNETETMIHEGPNIGDIIMNELNETMTISESAHWSPNDPGSSKNQVPANVPERRETHRTDDEEERERGGLNNTRNLFGAVVDNYKLDKMARYMGKPKTREDRAREAYMLVNEDDKDGKASRYVDILEPRVPLRSSQQQPPGTRCLFYNATGDTLYQVANHDWSGHIIGPPYPTTIGNGQWAAVFHFQPNGQSSIAAVVYRGKNRDGEGQDYLLAWRSPQFLFFHNKCYCEIGCVDKFQNSWRSVKKKLADSDLSSNAKSDGYEIQANTGKSWVPKFTAIISYR